jgi:hypothetical protein
MSLERSRGVSLIDVTDRVLDKGIVIDFSSRYSLLGVDILTTVEGRVIVASIDTYIKYAGPIEGTGMLAARLSRGAFDVNAARKR